MSPKRYAVLPRRCCLTAVTLQRCLRYDASSKMLKSRPEEQIYSDLISGKRRIGLGGKDKSAVRTYRILQPSVQF